MAFKHIPRLHVRAQLRPGGRVALTSAQALHLKVVLRRGEGSEVSVFNADDGEHTGALVGGTASVWVGSRTREPPPPPGPFGRGPLLLSPLLRSKDALQFLIEKAVEVGAGAILPLAAQRAQGRDRGGGGGGAPPALDASQARVQASYTASLTALGLADCGDGVPHIDRLQDWARGAAEQCGRLDVPPILFPSLHVEHFLRVWCEDGGVWLPPHRALLVCDEGVAGDPTRRLVHTLAQVRGGGGREAETAVAIAVGPEGGWSVAEAEALRSVCGRVAQGAAGPAVHRVSLGPRVLRAETAAVAALVEASTVLESRVRTGGG